jgi:hypothetical protein
MAIDRVKEMVIDWDEFNKSRAAILKFQEWQRKMGIEPGGYSLNTPYQILPTARVKECIM